MKLRTRFIVILGLFILMLTSLATFISTRLLLSSSLSLEEELVRESIEGGRHFLDLEERKLASVTEDWANGDDAYQFMADTNRTFIEVNLVDNTFKSLGLNVIAFLAPSRRPFFVKSFDLIQGIETVPPAPLLNTLTNASWLADSPGRSGLLLVESEIWLAATRPVHTSLGEGAQRGVLVMARRLNALSDWCPSRHWHGLFNLEAAPSNAPPLTITVESLGTISGRALLRDMHGRPSLMLENTIARRILSSGFTREFFLTGWLLLSGGAIGLVAFLLVDRWVLRHLSNSVDALKQGMNAVSARANLKLRLETMQEGEMRDLAVCLNDMLTALDLVQEASEKRRRELIHAQKMTALGTLVAGVAHEVNNPNAVVELNLTAIQRRLDRVFSLDAAEADRPALKRELEDLVTETREATKRISAITTTLKGFARVPSDRASANLDVNALIERIPAVTKHLLDKTGCRLSLFPCAPAPTVHGNAQQITQVLVNLVENAIQASPPGSEVEIATEHSVDTVLIYVRDRGAGIPPDILDRIFEPFFTTRRQQGGTGLGLYLSLEIIRAHGGTLTVCSSPGKGSAFTIQLPLPGGGEGPA